MGLDAGCNFIMMNYQKIDTNMSNYMYIFKEKSFIQKDNKHPAKAVEKREKYSKQSRRLKLN